jgi:spore germination protein YaaH
MNPRRFFSISFICALFCALCCASCASEPQNSNIEDGEFAVEIEIDGDEIELLELVDLAWETGDLPTSSFNEIWAYVVSGSETALKLNIPISDVVYFGAEVSSYGHLVDAPKRSKLARYNGRMHLSVACNSGGLTHFVIEPGSVAREILVREILAAAADYDGLNIDMELVPAKDSDNFISFLAELRAGLGRGKIFSVCVPARTRAGGPYNYEKLAFLADKVFVMAYDEHWSGSKAGPIASMNWCKSVATYALKSIGPEKLIMGIPFYGRAWGNTSTSRALINATTEKIKKEHGVETVKRLNGVPTFTYDVTVRVTVFYEDEYSLATRMEMYQGQGVEAIGFWRLGQESTAIWPLLNLNSHIARN